MLHVSLTRSNALQMQVLLYALFQCDNISQFAVRHCLIAWTLGSLCGMLETVTEGFLS